MVQVVASLSINPDEPEAVATYFGVAMPLIEKVGAKVLQKIEVGEPVVGEQPSELVMLVEYPSYEDVERVLELCPDTQIIAHAYWWLHLPNGTCDRMLEKYPNLYADVSGTRMVSVLNRDRGYTKDFLTRHQNKVLFATDAGCYRSYRSRCQSRRCDPCTPNQEER